MALIDTITDVLENARKAVAGVGFVVKSTATQLVTAAPTITSGSGAPSSAEPNGSMYLRTDATDGDDAVYSRVAGAWVPILGATA